MKKTGKTALTLLAVSAMFLSGCFGNNPPAGTVREKPVTETSGTVTETEPERTAIQTTETEITAETVATEPAPGEKTPREQAEDIVSGMTLEQKIAQMISISLRYWSDTPVTDGKAAEQINTIALNDKQKALLTQYDFGGITLFGTNTLGTEQTLRLNTGIQEAALASKNGIPMLISVDQEGGHITRLATGTKTCGNMALGATGDELAVRENAYIIGSELSALGFNNDFAPVLDVNNNPANPVIGVRSFSSDPQLVSRLGPAYIEGLHDNGIISTLKHFPGHGDTDTDSHTGLPLVDKSLDELKSLELIPFEEALKTADMVMTAHIQYPQIETQTYTSKESGKEIYLPATLSKTVITDILRGELEFDGVVVTDAMLMDAIKVNFDPIDAAVLAINADVDMLLEPVCIVDDESIEAIGKYISEIATAVSDGRIPEEQIDDSVVRIITMKIENGLYNKRIDTENDVINAKELVGSRMLHERELEIAEKAITLIKNNDDTLPLKLNDNETVAFFYPYEGEENAMAFALDRLKNRGTIPENVTAECHCIDEKNAAGFKDVISSSAAVILAVETYKRGNMDVSASNGWQAVFADELIETAHSLGKKVVVLSMQLPYDAARYTDADALLCAYCAMEMPVIPTEYNGETLTYGVNYPAALITVFGGNAPTGKLPADIPELDENTGFTDKILYPLGYGLSYDR